MRLIPGKTKVKIELFKGVTIGDVIVGVITLALVALVALSSFPGRLYIALVVLAIGAGLIFRLDEEPTYMLLIHFLRYLAYPRSYFRIYSDKQILAMAQGKEKEEFLSELNTSEEDPFADMTDKERKKAEKELWKEENRILKSKSSTDEEKNEVWKARAARSARKKKQKAEAKGGSWDEHFIEDVIPFTGVGDGFVEYDGKYYGTVIEIDPVEFRFFSEFRRKATIEEHVGKILRSMHDGFTANIVKIERPIIYDSYLEKEYDKLDALRASYESGLLSEEELQARVEIQYDRIQAMRDICFKEKVVQPFYYLMLFHSDKRQLTVDTNQALTDLREGELPVRRLMDDKELCVFLKYTNSVDFEERDIEKLRPEDYIAWAMPENLSVTTRYTKINRIITHTMRVATYPSIVGDAWLAGVMSIPGTKVVVKCTPMDRAASIRAIDRSLAELRGQYSTTSVDSKLLELEEHISTLSELLVTLQQDNEALLTVNIYISMYDVVKTSGEPDGEFAKSSLLPVIAEMKKTVRRAWQETGMRLNPMDFAQLQGFIGSQVSAYDPFVKDGRGIPSNTIAGMYPWIYANISDEGGIQLGEHDGVPVFIDFFRRDSERVNSNMVIIGKSGAGKSYGTKSLLVNMASENAKIYILDPENEYTELAENLHGKVINVGNASQGRLNPFQIITALDDDEAGEESAGGSFATHLQFLEEFFKQILPDLDKDSLEYLNSLVERTYNNKGITIETNLANLTPADYPVFDDLYDVVLEEFQRTENQYLRTMLQTLMNYVAKFSTGGRNANIWNGPSSISTEENFTVFNFQSLLSNRNQTIANAQMLLVLKYIDNEIIKNRDYNRKYNLSRKIVVVIDEAHVFIDTKFPAALDFMFQLAKRIRKYNGMQIVITQNIKDFVGSEEIARKSTAIINACQYSFIFGLAPNDMDDLCRLYEKAGGINEVEQEQILNAPRGQAFAIMSPSSRSAFMVSVPQSMVEMFEHPGYVSHYFTGEGGKENWEDFVAKSRSLHEQNAGEKALSSGVEEIVRNSKKSSIHFEEISAEEADKMEPFAEFKGITFEEMEAEVPEEPKSAGIHFEEVTEPQPVAPQPVAPQPVAPQATGLPLDINGIIALVRAEVEREFEARYSSMIPQPQPTPIPMPIPEPIAQPTPEMDTASMTAEETEDTEEFDKFFDEDSMDESTEEMSDMPEDSSMEEEPTEEMSEEESGGFEFDVMALLEEQLESYSNMNVVERMEEIDVNTMEITVEDLAAYIKDRRKKVGA